MLKSPLGAASLLAALLGGGSGLIAQIQVTINDSLPGIHIFAQSSPEFTKIASNLGVDASLKALGEALPLVVAIRNDSGEALESMRILYLVARYGKLIPRVVIDGPLASGGSMVFAPQEASATLEKLVNPNAGPGKPRAQFSAQPLDFYRGSPVTVSIDSATLASGRFVGADTQVFFPRLVAEAAAKKAFLTELSGYQSAGLSQAQIEQALNKRKSTADTAMRQMTSITELNLAAQAESQLSMEALLRLQNFGMAPMADWVARENAGLANKPVLHK